MLATCAEWLETLTTGHYSLMVNLRPDEDSGTLHKVVDRGKVIRTLRQIAHDPEE